MSYIYDIKILWLFLISYIYKHKITRKAFSLNFTSLGIFHVTTDNFQRVAARGFIKRITRQRERGRDIKREREEETERHTKRDVQRNERK